MSTVTDETSRADLYRELQELNALLDRLDRQVAAGEPSSTQGAPETLESFSTLSAEPDTTRWRAPMAAGAGYVEPGRPLTPYRERQTARSLFVLSSTSDYEMQFLNGYLQRQVSDMVQKLHGYVQRYSNLVDCAPMVTECVQLHNQGQYVKALSKGYEAYRCIQAKL